MTPTAPRRPPYGEGRQALVTATVRVVARGGVRRLSYRSVAAEAGVTHGTVQHHFASLDGLLEAALEHCVDLSIDVSALSQGTDRVEDFVVGLGAAVARTADEQAFQYEVLLESRHRPQLRPHVDRYYAAYHQALSSALRTMGLPDDPASTAVVFSALDGLVFRAVVLGDEGFETVEPALDRLRCTLRQLRETPRPR